MPVTDWFWAEESVDLPPTGAVVSPERSPEQPHNLGLRNWTHSDPMCHPSLDPKSMGHSQPVLPVVSLLAVILQEKQKCRSPFAGAPLVVPLRQ